MKRKRALSILIAAAMAVSATGCGGGSSSNTSAVEMRVQRQAGTVSLSNEKGESVTLLEKMRLNAGHNLDTAKESLVTVSMDETRILTLGEEGEASVKQDGNTLRFEVTKGTALVGLTEELKDDQAVEVRSGNMICGIRGTYVEYANKNLINVPENKTQTFLVLESKKENGVEVKALDANGNERQKLNVGAGEKVVLKIDNPPESQGQSQSRVGVDLSGSGTQGVLEKSKCNLEDFSATTLNAIPQQEGLIKSVSETFGLQESDTKELVSLFSQTGTSGGDSNASLPLFGEQAQAMENAAKATKETTGNETKAEIAVLKSTREVMDKAVEKVLDPEELVKITQLANEEMNEVVKTIIDDGAAGVGLNEIVKDTSDHLASMAVMGIEMGLKGDDVNSITRASAEGLILSVENKSFEDRSNAIDAEIKRQHEQKNAISQWSQNFFARNTGSDARDLNALLDGLKNASRAQPADNPVIVIPTPEPAPEPEPEPVAVVDDDDDDDDDDYSYTPPTPSSSAAPRSYGVTSINYYVNFGPGKIVSLNQYASGKYIGLFTTGVSGLDGLLTAGKSVTINVALKPEKNVYSLIAKSGGNDLYPKIDNGTIIYGPNGPSQGLTGNEHSITITWPESDISLDVVFQAYAGYLLNWDSTAGLSIATSDGTVVIAPDSYSTEYFKVTPSNPSTSVYYVTINNGEIKEMPAIPPQAQGENCFIVSALQPVFDIYTK